MKHNFKTIVKKFGNTEKDTGNTAVQIALFTQRINHLTKHLKVHKKDFSTRRGLLIIIGKRKRLINYLMTHNRKKCEEILKALNIRFSASKLS